MTIVRYVIKRDGVVFGAILSIDLMTHHIWVDNEKDILFIRAGG